MLTGLHQTQGRARGGAIQRRIHRRRVAACRSENRLISARRNRRASVVVELKAHAIVNFIVLQSDVVLVNCVPSVGRQERRMSKLCAETTSGVAAARAHHFWMRIFSGRVPASSTSRAHARSSESAPPAAPRSAHKPTLGAAAASALCAPPRHAGAHRHGRPPASSGRRWCRPHCGTDRGDGAGQHTRKHEVPRPALPPRTCT